MSMLLSFNNKKTVGWYTGGSDIAQGWADLPLQPLVWQTVTMPKWQQHTVPTNAVSLHTGGGSNINTASNFVENNSHLLMTAVKTKKKSK